MTKPQFRLAVWFAPLCYWFCIGTPGILLTFVAAAAAREFNLPFSFRMASAGVIVVLAVIGGRIARRIIRETASLTMDSTGLSIQDGNTTRRLRWNDFTEMYQESHGARVNLILETASAPVYLYPQRYRDSDVMVQTLCDYLNPVLDGRSPDTHRP